MTQYTSARTRPHVSTEFTNEAALALAVLDPLQSQRMAEYARTALRPIVDLTTAHALGETNGTPGERWLARHQPTYANIINAHKEALSTMVLTALRDEPQPSYRYNPNAARTTGYEVISDQIADSWEQHFGRPGVEGDPLQVIALGLTGVYGTLKHHVPVDCLTDELGFQAALQQYAATTLTPALTPVTANTM